MKKLTILAISALGLTLSSCSNYNTPEANNAATGALIGGGVGALTGSDGAETRRNAAIGAAVGGGAGYLYGKQQ